MTAYYNEIDPYAAQWLRNLIDAGHIAHGVVDTRSIEDVRPRDIDGFTQCHFFAGIGVWSYALRLAGWPDDRPVWTGSCPCQPFSSAGKGAGFDDERHLWPAWHWLIGECRPAVVFGEQVASKDGLAWLDLVHADMEEARYAFGAADLCAAGVGAPHIRQRLFWVANANRSGRPTRQQGLAPMGHGPTTSAGVGACVLGDGDGERLEGWQLHAERVAQCAPRAAGVDSHWHTVDWLLCRDPAGPRWRPVEPGTFPLAHGAPARVGRLRAYGNAIVAPLAAEFIRAYLDCRP